MAAIDVYTRVADEADAHMLAPRVIPEEVEELRVSMGCTPIEALLHGVRTSTECWSVLFNGELAFMWGVTRSPVPFAGNGWLLASGLVQRYPITFWRHCLEGLPAVLERWPVLFNAIDVRHKRALRWGERLGFQWRPRVVFEGLEFAPFLLTKEGHACAVQRA